MTPDNTVQNMIAWLDQNQAQFIAMAEKIWHSPELAWKEFKASRLQADLLEKEGFSIRWIYGEESTAFIADPGLHRGV
jgi:aminobenzoyl-glutamate utilization protein B